MAVPTRTRVVRAASHASATIASGEGLGDATCPPTQREAIGSDSRYSTSLAAPPDITPKDRPSDVGTMRWTLSAPPTSQRPSPRRHAAPPRSIPMAEAAERDYSLFGDEHIAQYEATDGEVGYLWNGAPCLVLHTTGRTSGEQRKFALIFGERDDDLVLVASKGGAPDHPGWYLN